LVSSTAVVFGALLIGTVIALRSARDARENARLARVQEYQARLSAAVAALSGHDVADAARHLERAPVELRGWEWRHLRRRLDDRSGRIVAASGVGVILVRRPDGIEVGQLDPKVGLRLTDLDGQLIRTIPCNAEAESAASVLQTNGGVRFMHWGERGPHLSREVD